MSTDTALNKQAFVNDLTTRIMQLLHEEGTDVATSGEHALLDGGQHHYFRVVVSDDQEKLGHRKVTTTIAFVSELGQHESTLSIPKDIVDRPIWKGIIASMASAAADVVFGGEVAR